MRHALLAAVAILTAATLPASAGEAGAPAGAEPQNVSQIVNVIELYTSQGCSSCPPADALMQTYAKRPDVLMLSLPVDYWDYLGWKDTLGSAKHTERQRNYARARGDGQVYTPQAVINGIAHAVGSSKSAIDAALTLTRDEIAASRVPLKFWTNGGSLFIEAGAAAPNSSFKDGTVWLAVIQPTVDVEIARGENRGRKVTYTNVVRELTPVGTWTGQPMRIQLARTSVMRKDLERVAVLIQSGKAGPIIGAAVTGLW
ncbi:MAG: DUF1223 domain-containing protein [Hyphomicrobium aestuarii]|nr:DUF1223 domain-containing protein [Hyphomicrobium aestuarii]